MIEHMTEVLPSILALLGNSNFVILTSAVKYESALRSKNVFYSQFVAEIGLKSSKTKASPTICMVAIETGAEPHENLSPPKSASFRLNVQKGPSGG